MMTIEKKTNATVNSKLWSVYKDYALTMKKIDACHTQMVRVCYSLMKNVNDEIEYARKNGTTNFLKYYVVNVVQQTVKNNYRGCPSIASQLVLDFCNRTVKALQ